MIYPNKEEYIKRSAAYNVVPIYKKYFIDTETPATIFLKLGGASPEKQMFLLESIEGIKRLSRYSFIGAGFSHLIRFENGIFSVSERSDQRDREIIRTKTNLPLSELERFLSGYRIYKDHELTHFIGGAVGYLSYDLVKYFENIDIPQDDPDFPEMMLYITDCLVVFDHLLNTISIIATVKNDGEGTGAGKSYENACRKIEDLENLIFDSYKNSRLHEELIKTSIINNGNYHSEVTPDEIPENTGEVGTRTVVRSNFTRDGFIDAVNKAKKYINEGEVFQLVLSQRFEVKNIPESLNVFNIYRILRNLNPSPYMYYLSFGDFRIVGSSPEPLIKISGRKIITCPIAGTRKRGKSIAGDRKLITDLLSDKKEKAEHNMLVDLSRNDLGRVCEYGSVKLKRYMKVEKYSHVIHLVSRVEGLLRKDKTIFDALMSTFPAGTLTGAPKIRAMQLISELEPERRGPYGGIIGYFGFDKSLDCCITIRTALLKGSKAFVQAGAGIVYDSVAESEYQETINKASALLDAIKRGT
jgi:anthranilate synthase component I